MLVSILSSGHMTAINHQYRPPAADKENVFFLLFLFCQLVEKTTTSDEDEKQIQSWGLVAPADPELPKFAD